MYFMLTKSLDIKEHVSVRDNLVYNVCVGMTLFFKKERMSIHPLV